MLVFAATLCVLIILTKCQAPTTLQLTNVLFRHGDRSPMVKIPGDLHDESAWPQGYSQLSQIGMRQEHELGQTLGKRYQGFLSKDYIRNEVRVESTDTERTLMSAQVVTAGLYPPTESQPWNQDLNWRPIPIHNMAWEKKAYTKANCGKNRIEDKRDLLLIKRKYKSIFNIVETSIGEKITDMGLFWDITDTLYCEHIHNKSLPVWATDDLVYIMYHKIMPDFFNMSSCAAPSRGVVLAKIIADMKEKIFNKTRSPTKAFFYSAHDSTMVALLCSLEVYNLIQVPYSSALMVELHYRDPTHSTPMPSDEPVSSDASSDIPDNLTLTSDGQRGSSAGSHGVRTRGWFVQVWLHNETGRDPYRLTVPGCSDDCPLDEFINITSTSIKALTSLPCSRTSVSIVHLDHLWRIGLATVGVGGAVILVVVIITLYCHHSYKQKRDRAESPVRYSQLKMEDIPMTTATAMETEPM